MIDVFDFISDLLVDVLSIFAKFCYMDGMICKTCDGDGGVRMPQNFWNIGKRQILENLEPSMPSRQKSSLKQNIVKGTMDQRYLAKREGGGVREAFKNVLADFFR